MNPALRDMHKLTIRRHMRKRIDTVWEGLLGSLIMSAIMPASRTQT